MKVVNHQKHATHLGSIVLVSYKEGTVTSPCQETFVAKDHFVQWHPRRERHSSQLLINNMLPEFQENILPVTEQVVPGVFLESYLLVKDVRYQEIRDCLMQLGCSGDVPVQTVHQFLREAVLRSRPDDMERPYLFPVAGVNRRQSLIHAWYRQGEQAGSDGWCMIEHGRYDPQLNFLAGTVVVVPGRLMKF